MKKKIIISKRQSGCKLCLRYRIAATASLVGYVIVLEYYIKYNGGSAWQLNFMSSKTERIKECYGVVGVEITKD